MTTLARWAPALALALLSGLGGCASPSPSPSDTCLRPEADGLALIVPAHAGAVTRLSHVASCALGEALLRDVPVVIVTSEGQPRVVTNVPGLDGTYPTERARRAAVVREGNLIAEEASSIAPTSHGNDLNAALSVAQDAVRAQGAQRPHLISSDSGLTDSGALRMTLPGMLVADPNEVAADLHSHGQCPVTSGTHVTFVGLGYGVSPQSPLTPADRAHVTALWSSVVTTCGGTVDERPQPAAGEGPQSQFTVLPVEPSGYTDPRLDDPITLAGESAFAFDHDRVDFKYPDQANAVLDTIVATLTAHPTWHLRIEGTTARGATAYPSLEALGLARAEAVKEALVRRGVEPSRLETVGHGYLADPPQVDAATSALNRRTILVYFRP